MPRPILSAATVQAARDLRRTGMSLAEIAYRLGCSRRSIQNKLGPTGRPSRIGKPARRGPLRAIVGYVQQQEILECGHRRFRNTEQPWRTRRRCQECPEDPRAAYHRQRHAQIVNGTWNRKRAA